MAPSVSHWPQWPWGEKAARSPGWELCKCTSSPSLSIPWKRRIILDEMVMTSPWVSQAKGRGLEGTERLLGKESQQCTRWTCLCLLRMLWEEQIQHWAEGPADAFGSVAIYLIPTFCTPELKPFYNTRRIYLISTILQTEKLSRGWRSN